jgi:hypothetical protein
MSDLLPCPFCGAMLHRVVSKTRSFNPPRDYVEWHHDAPAVNCYLYNIRGPRMASTADNTKAKADFIAAWNRRASPAQPADAVERVAKLICSHAAVDECNDVDSYFAAATHHSGDCTKEAHTCILCRVTLYRDLARQVIAALSAPRTAAPTTQTAKE